MKKIVHSSSLKKEYNETLKRHDKATEYIDNNNIAITDREKWVSEYKNIINKLNHMVNEINKIKVMTNNEVLGGFKDD